MAVDPMARRGEGVSALPESATRGSRGTGNDAGSAPFLPTSTLDERMEAPGGHVNRGVEANTNLFGSDAPPMVDIVVAGERPVVSDPFAAPDNSGSLACGDEPDRRWNTSDSSARNELALNVPHDSFSGIGESYPANGGLDGRT